MLAHKLDGLQNSGWWWRILFQIVPRSLAQYFMQGPAVLSLREFRKPPGNDIVEEGGQATVKPCMRERKLYARKEFHRANFARSEAHILSKIATAVSNVGFTRHPHLPRLVLESEKTLILEPWCDKKFEHYWTKDKRSDLPNIPRQFLCLARTVSFLHGNEMKHKDVHDGNVLFVGNTVVLTDFGFSRHHRAESSFSANLVRKRYFESPDTGNTRATDVFQLGLVFSKALLLTFDENLDLFKEIFERHARPQTRFYGDQSLGLIPQSFGVADDRSPWKREGCEELLAALARVVPRDLYYIVEIVREMIHVEAKKRLSALRVCMRLQDPTGYSCACDNIKIVECEYENDQRATISEIECLIVRLAELYPSADPLKLHQMMLNGETYTAIETVRGFISEEVIGDNARMFDEARDREQEAEEMELRAVEEAELQESYMERYAEAMDYDEEYDEDFPGSPMQIEDEL